MLLECLKPGSFRDVSSGGGHKRQKVDSTKVNTLFQETESGDCALYSKVNGDRYQRFIREHFSLRN